MKTKDAGEQIAVVVSAMAAYVPEAVVERGVGRCQYCHSEVSLLDKPAPHPHTKLCPVTRARRILMALGQGQVVAGHD